MKVSNVSVSRRAGPPHLRAGGLAHCGSALQRLPLPVNGTTSSGSSTGNWSSGTGSAPQAAQWITGIGQPQ